MAVLTRGSGKVPPELQRCTVIQGDLTCPDSLAHFIKPGAVVIHLAYLNKESAQTNLAAAENLANACRRAGIRRFVHCSTALVVGHVPDQIVDESTVCQPQTVYEKTKLAIENQLVERLQPSCDCIILRPTVVFGKGGKNLIKLVNEIVEQPRLLSLLRASLYGQRPLHLVPVENVVAALRFLAFQELTQSGAQTFLIADDEAPENQYAHLLTLVCQIFEQRKIPTGWLPLRTELLRFLLQLTGKTTDDPNRVYCCDKLLQQGFVKPVDLDDSLHQFLTWYRQEGRQK